MRKNNSEQKKSNKHQKSKRKVGLLDRMNLWFVQHSTIACILDASVLLFSAGGRTRNKSEKSIVWYNSGKL